MFKSITTINLTTTTIDTVSTSSTMDRYSCIKVTNREGIYNFIDVITIISKEGEVRTFASLEDIELGEENMIYVEIPRNIVIQTYTDEETNEKSITYIFPEESFLDDCYGDQLTEFLSDYLPWEESYKSFYWDAEEIDGLPHNYEDEDSRLTINRSSIPFGGRTLDPQYTNSKGKTVYVTYLSAQGFNDLLNKVLYGDLPEDECLSGNILIVQTEKKVLNVYLGTDLVDYDDPSKDRTIFFSYYTDISQRFQPEQEWYLEDYNMSSPTIAQVAQFFETIVVPAVAKEIDK